MIFTDFSDARQVVARERSMYNKFNKRSGKGFFAEGF